MVRHGFLGRAAVWAALLSFMGALTATLPTAIAQDGPKAQFRKDKLVLKTSTGEHVIAIEVAETNEQKSLGLMFRTSVPPSTGMLFPYDEPHELTMWMRNTVSSLDMIFIRRDGTVHRIEYSAEPLSERVISSKGNVTAVLEVAAGEAKRLGVKPGDRVDYRTFTPAKR